MAPEPDGAFDLTGLGEPGALRWPDGISVDHSVVDDLTPEVVALLSALEPRAAYLTAPSGEHPLSWTKLHLVDTGDGSTQPSVETYP